MNQKLGKLFLWRDNKLLLSNQVEKRGEDVGTRSSNLKSPHVLEEIPILSQLMLKNMNIEIKDDK